MSELDPKALDAAIEAARAADFAADGEYWPNDCYQTVLVAGITAYLSTRYEQRWVEVLREPTEARNAALEEAATWHDTQASAWQDQAIAVHRQIHGADEEYAAEFRAQHEAYTKYRIIHEHSARDLRALKSKPDPSAT